MALNLKQSLKLTQQLLMTPQLQQAIKLLQLSRQDLEEFVANQIIDNPVLEDLPFTLNGKDSFTQEKTSGFSESNIAEDRDFNAESKLENVERFGDQTSRVDTMQSFSKYPAFREEGVNYENVLTKPQTLQEYLFSQIYEIEFDDEERKIAASIIGNINDNGYFDYEIETFSIEEKFEIEKVEGVLDAIQRLDPPGVGARNLSECLQIQLRVHGLKNGIVEKIVELHMKELESHNYPLIAKKLNLSLEDVIKNVGIIVGLNPVPGIGFGENNAQTILPDVYVFKVSDQWVVALNEDNLPKLRVNKFYQNMSESGGKTTEKAYLQEKIKSANWLIKSLQQRQRTILKVAETIVEKQVKFLEQGIRYLKPMVLREIADAVEMHESTISRVTNNKYLHTPRGVFELKYFFSSSIKSSNNTEDVSSSFVKETIKELITQEDLKKPLSDQKIVMMLSEKGVHLARRTVAKYREQVGILPSSKRKKHY